MNLLIFRQITIKRNIKQHVFKGEKKKPNIQNLKCFHSSYK